MRHLELQEELRSLLNRHGMDSATNIPDRTLADHVINHILELGRMQRSRDKWMGFENHLTKKGFVEL